MHMMIEFKQVYLKFNITDSALEFQNGEVTKFRYKVYNETYIDALDVDCGGKLVVEARGGKPGALTWCPANTVSLHLNQNNEQLPDKLYSHFTIDVSVVRSKNDCMIVSPSQYYSYMKCNTSDDIPQDIKCVSKDTVKSFEVNCHTPIEERRFCHENDCYLLSGQFSGVTGK